MNLKNKTLHSNHVANEYKTLRVLAISYFYASAKYHSVTYLFDKKEIPNKTFRKSKRLNEQQEN